MPEQPIEQPVETTWLQIPVGQYKAWIPLGGMSEEDFTLMLETINLWKRRIVVPQKPEQETK